MQPYRYDAKAVQGARKIPRYIVIDIITGEIKAEFDCMRWAERKAEELNKRRQGETQGGEKPEKEGFSMAVPECKPET